MAANSAIAWTDHTFNIVWGCVKVSPGCAHCYAEAVAGRYGAKVWGPNAERRTFSDKHWRDPLKWNAAAKRRGQPARVFCGSMCDWREDNETVEAQIDRLHFLWRSTPWLHWQMLTKRADRIASGLPADWSAGYPNVWLGVSIENADYVWRADHLRELPAVVRFVSYEPALGPLRGLDLAGLDWIIYGGESGPRFRVDDRQWARDMQLRCHYANVPFFHKQSAGRFPGTGVEIDGEIVYEFPTPRRVEHAAFEVAS